MIMMRTMGRSAKAMLAWAAMLLVAGNSAAQERPSAPRPAPETDVQVPELPPAVIDNALAIDGEEVDAQKIETRLSVEVGVNGTGPYKFIVDSGADTSAVGFRIAEGLQLPLSTPATMVTINSRDIVDRVEVASLELGPTTVNDLILPVLRERDMGGDGMIGIDALAKQRLMMDFDEKVIRIEDSRTKVRSQPGDIVIVAKRRRGQLILTEVDASGIKLDAIVDTGSQVTIGNSALRREFARHKVKTEAATYITGVTGQTARVEVVTLKQLDLGPITLRNVPIVFADVQPFTAFGLADEPALMLGTDILENFSKVSLDFRTRKVRFQLRKCGRQRIVVGPSISRATRMRANDPAACQ